MRMDVTKECIDRANYLLGMNERMVCCLTGLRNDENKGAGVDETHLKSKLHTRTVAYSSLDLHTAKPC